MNKVEFMRQLERLLQNISEQERQEALHYYDDYFDDAGPENEQAVLEALGNPARVAENIRRDLYGAGYGDGYVVRKPVTGRELAEYGTAAEEEQGQETIRQNTTTAQQTVYAGASAADAWQGSAQANPVWENTGGGEQGGFRKADKEPLPGWLIALIVILCIFCLPVACGLLGAALGVAVGLLGAVLGLAAAWFAMILGFGIAALVCIIMGICISGIGIAGIGLHPLAGLGLIGGGLIVIAIGVLFMMLTAAMAGWVTPAIFRGIGHLISRKKKTA